MEKACYAEFQKAQETLAKTKYVPWHNSIFYIYKCVDYLHNHNNLIRLRVHMHSYGYLNSLNIYLQSTKETERVFSSPEPKAHWWAYCIRLSSVLQTL